MSISEQESQELREQSVHKGVTFSDAQWSHFIHKILEPRLDRQERIRHRELEEAKQALQRGFDRRYAEMLSQSEALQADAIRGNALNAPDDLYEQLRQQHLSPLNRE